MTLSLTPPWAQLPSSIAHITLVGLGPGDLADLTLGGWQALQGARHLFLRTQRHPCVAALESTLRQAGIPITSFDALYERHADFAQVYAAIADQVVGAGTEGGVVYAMPGHPWVGEATTALICQQASEAGLTVAVVGAASFIEPVCAALALDPMDGCQVVDAMILAQQHYPQIDVGLPLLAPQLYSDLLAGDVKLTLLNAYPEEHPVRLVRAAGTTQQAVQDLPLFELDRQDDLDHLTTLYVPPLTVGSMSHLQELVAHLRAPEGCPWDREQTLTSLRRDFLDECHELLEAIDAEDDDHTAEELGDVLLLATLFAQIAVEEGRFRLANVVHHIVTKLIRRHPHVFGELEVESVDQLIGNWDAIKVQERAEQGLPERGPLDGLSPALPALEKARRLQSKADKAGLLDRAALAASTPLLAQLLPPGIDEEALGQLLWEIVALAHTRGLTPEDALRAYTVHFRAGAG